VTDGGKRKELINTAKLRVDAFSSGNGGAGHFNRIAKVDMSGCTGRGTIADEGLARSEQSGEVVVPINRADDESGQQSTESASGSWCHLTFAGSFT
jgi:hypothetical protein